jgi:hypothetical protein
MVAARKIVHYEKEVIVSMANHEKQHTITDMKAILAGFTDVSNR